jgi:hypothetical protein
MPETEVFKRGSDLEPAAGVEDEDTVTCVTCGATESDQCAFESGWQLVPAVCPDCQSWTVVAECCQEGPS